MSTQIITDKHGKAVKLVHYIHNATPHIIRKWRECNVDVRLLYPTRENTILVVTHKLNCS